jgi:hypothetical protein
VKRALIAVCCLAMLAAGCGKSNESANPTSEPSIVATQTPQPTPCSLEGATTATKKSEGDPPFTAVTDVRPNAAGGCPRVVFEFRGDQPAGHSVGYAKAPFSECGSGEEVSTQTWNADAYLRVRLSPSSGVDLMHEAEPTYKGPRDIPLHGSILKHMKVICDFEAVFEWIIGLDAKHPFTVTTFESPPRLVIDISGA